MTFWQILPSVLSILSTVIIGLVGWGFRSTLSEIRSSIQKNAAEIDKVDKRASEKIERLENNFNDLKADLPMVYVLRDEFIRCMNNVEKRMDKHMDDISTKLDRIMEKR